MQLVAFVRTHIGGFKVLTVAGERKSSSVYVVSRVKEDLTTFIREGTGLRIFPASSEQPRAEASSATDSGTKARESAKKYPTIGPLNSELAYVGAALTPSI